MDGNGYPYILIVSFLNMYYKTLTKQSILSQTRFIR